MFDLSVALYSTLIPIIYLLELRAFNKWTRSNNPVHSSHKSMKRRRRRRGRSVWGSRRVAMADGDTVTAVPTGGTGTGRGTPANAPSAPKPLHNLVGDRLNPDDKAKETVIYFVQLQRQWG